MTNIDEVDLHCAVCTELFIQPTTLMCQHTFCHTCITDRSIHSCPICRMVKFAPPETNLIIENMIKQVMGPPLYEVAKARKLEEARTKNREYTIACDIEKRIWRTIAETIHQTGISIAPIESPPKETFKQNLAKNFKKEPFANICMGIITATLVVLTYKYNTYFKSR